MSSISLPRLRPLLTALLLAGLLHPASPAHSVEPAPLPLAQRYSDQIDPARYLVSEKLDGVRAWWDGKTLRFRSGRPIHAPGWFTAALPSHALDGELWMGRRSFDALSAAVRRQEPNDSEWKRISYQVYELPNGEGSFDERVITLRASVERAGVPWLQVLPQARVADRTTLQKQLMEVVHAGGEGLMLHRADAPWQVGRTDALLKLKLHSDDEAVVVAHEAGKGKYEGMLGALIVAMPDGRRFRLGTGLSDALRRTPPPVGSTVTYRYRDVTANGLPRFASFLRVREGE